MYALTLITAIPACKDYLKLLLIANRHLLNQPVHWTITLAPGPSVIDNTSSYQNLHVCKHTCSHIGPKDQRPKGPTRDRITERQSYGPWDPLGHISGLHKARDNATRPWIGQLCPAHMGLSSRFLHSCNLQDDGTYQRHVGQPCNLINKTLLLERLDTLYT